MAAGALPAPGFQFNDGGRAAAGFTGTTGDCVARAVAIATQMPYDTVYRALSEGMGTQRRSKHYTTRRASARSGISTRRKWFKDFMVSIGWKWTPTMHIGSGCQVHLRAEELPTGRLVVAVSKHYCAVIDGVINDIYDPRRETGRCVYGYWSKAEAAQ